MKLYVLDTDIAGFVQNGHPAVIARINTLPDEEVVVTTIVTFGEDLSGWMPACRRASDSNARAQVYARLKRGLDFYRQMICLPFDNAAAMIFDQLRTQKLRVGTSDLSIAAITLSVKGILVMRNIVDFQRIPGLILEDWTRS